MSTDDPGTPPQEAPRSAKTNTLAIISLVCGVLSFPLICCWPVGIVVGIAAVALGLIARSQIAKTGEGGGGLAIAGAVLGAIMVVAIVALLAVGMTVDVEALQKQLQQQQQPQMQPGIEQPGGELGEPGELELDFDAAPAPDGE